MAHLSPLESRYKFLKEQSAKEDLMEAEHKELQLLELIRNQYDDLEDFCNWTKALNRVSGELQDTIKHHYYQH